MAAPGRNAGWSRSPNGDAPMASAIVGTILLVAITMSLGATAYVFLGQICAFNGSCIPPICETIMGRERLGIDANGTILYRDVTKPLNPYDTKCMNRAPALEAREITQEVTTKNETIKR